MDALVNAVFHVAHLGLILFHLFAPIVPRLRVLHFWSLTHTLVSWVGLGLFYGFGYCPLTDWHWQRLGQMGVSLDALPRSYVTYLLYTGREMPKDENYIDLFVAVVSVSLWFLSLRFFIRNLIERNQKGVG